MIQGALCYAHTNRFYTVQENTKPDVLKVQTELARALYFPVQHKTGCYEFYYLIASNSDPYHLAKGIFVIVISFELLANLAGLKQLL